MKFYLILHLSYIFIALHAIVISFRVFSFSKLSNLIQIIMYEVISHLTFKLYIYLFIVSYIL